MKILLAFMTTAVILSLIVIIKLFLKIKFLYGKIKYVDEANMWHKLAVMDDLTSVYNRTAYNMHVERKAQKEPRAIMLFDVDDFKTINDREGHLAGDAILKEAAKILCDVFYESEYTVFRIGGDEFSVISEGVSEKEIIERLIDLKKRLERNGKISLSKGYSLVYDSFEKAFDDADRMLYADKLSKDLHISSLSKNS